MAVRSRRRDEIRKGSLGFVQGRRAPRYTTRTARFGEGGQLNWLKPAARFPLSRWYSGRWEPRSIAQRAHLASMPAQSLRAAWIYLSRIATADRWPMRSCSRSARGAPKDVVRRAEPLPQFPKRSRLPSRPTIRSPTQWFRFPMSLSNNLAGPLLLTTRYPRHRRCRSRLRPPHG